MALFNWQINTRETSQSRNFTPFGSNQGQLTNTQAAQLRATGFQGLRTLDRKHEQITGNPKAGSASGLDQAWAYQDY
jgi:hypothetical protein